MSARKLWLAAALLCIAIACWWFLRPGANYVNFPPTATGSWVAFGDSLTAGFGATEGNGYPAVLGRTLRVSIQNLGRSGETTSDALNRLEEVARMEPRVVLLCFGGNDSLSQHSRTQTFANLSRMIDRFHQAGSFVVLIGIRSASLRDYNEEHFARLARDKRVLYVPDMLRGLVFKPVYMSDAIHPNDAGYQKIAARLEKQLRPLLPKLISQNASNSIHGQPGAQVALLQSPIPRAAGPP
jgi:acyl-CoA thioesterase I